MSSVNVLLSTPLDYMYIAMNDYTEMVCYYRWNVMCYYYYYDTANIITKFLVNQGIVSQLVEEAGG